MKNILYLILLIFPVLLYNCGPDNLLKPTPEPDVLPPITTEGLNTAGCLVNGEVWLPKPGGMFKPAIHCNYYPRIQGSDPRLWGGLQLDLANHDQKKFIYVGHDSLYTIGDKTLYLNHIQPSEIGGGIFWS